MFSLSFVSIETPVASKSWVIEICLCEIELCIRWAAPP